MQSGYLNNPAQLESLLIQAALLPDRDSSTDPRPITCPTHTHWSIGDLGSDLSIWLLAAGLLC